MDEKKTQKFRQRLLEEYQKLIRSINRNRLAEEEIKLENTEDEGDLATISHNKELLYNLHESDFQRLKSIQEALKRMDYQEAARRFEAAEPLLLDLTEHLVQWSTDVPLLILVAARPELRDVRSSLAVPGGLVSDVVTLAGLDQSPQR
jgi:hypothetical protein